MRYVASRTKSISWTIAGSDDTVCLVRIKGFLAEPSSTRRVMMQGVAGAFLNFTNKLPAVALHWRQNRVTKIAVAGFMVLPFISAVVDGNSARYEYC